MEAHMRAGHKRRVVLIVEDDALIRSDFVSEFNWQGWTVLDTGRGEEAIALAEDNHIDVLLTDIQLIGSLSGWDVAEAIRARRPELVVVYASGSPPDRARLVRGGLFFGKPCDPAEVVSTCH